MSDVCGIFQKRCPQCAAAVAKSAAHCGCGYSFDTETPTSGIAQSLAEEKLYEDYLNARVMQTAQAAIEAQAVQQTRPDDPAATAAVFAALNEAEAARRDLSAQSARVEELRQAMVAEVGMAALTDATASEAASAPAIAKAPVTIIEAPQVLAPVSARAGEVARAAEALRAELAKLRQDTGRPAGAVQSIKTARGAQAAPSAVLAKKTCEQCQTEVLASARRCRCGFSFMAAGPVAESAHIPKIEEVLARAEGLKKSRRESAQAEKAARIHEARLARAAERSKMAKPDSAILAPGAPETTHSAVHNPHAASEAMLDKSPAPPVIATSSGNAAEPAYMSVGRAPTPAILSAPARSDELPKAGASACARTPVSSTAKVGSSMQHLSVCIAPARPLATMTVRDTKDCPNCTASVATATMRCKCGFEFRSASGGSPMPGLSLDVGEQIKVRDLYMRR